MEAQNADLSALRIDRQKESEESGKSKRTTWLVSAVVILAIILAAYFALGNALTQAVEVSLTTVALSSPSQSNAVLTASGYVVAQRKASVASILEFFRISTLNFGSFAELEFAFSLSPSIIVSSLIFAMSMGLIGGFLPSVRAARLSIVDALRAS